MLLLIALGGKKGFKKSPSTFEMYANRNHQSLKEQDVVNEIILLSYYNYSACSYVS